MTKYYLSHSGQQLGPWSEDEIVQKLKGKEIVWTDYVFDEAKKDWVVLMDHAIFAPHFKYAGNESSAQSETQPSPVSSAASGEKKEKEWFILKGDNRYGPFGYLEVIRMLQEKNVFEFDYVWNQTQSGWKRIADCEEFKPDQIKALKASGEQSVEEIFFRRRHVRARYGASLIVHNNKTVWRGESLEISAFGAGIVVDTQLLEPGQTVFLHFKPGDGVPPFNALCSVVSKEAVKMADQSKVRYGVKFTSISQNVQKAIKTFAEKTPAAAS